MKQTASIIPTYTADISGVCSALYELGGMSVMHDASGCNSTYNSHDEPRWYDMDSLVFLSGITEMEAIMGDDEKLIGDIVSAAEQFRPRFVAIAGTPIPMMIGTDFEAIADIVEQRTGIPAFGISTNGMHSYISGAGRALEAYARRFITKPLPKTEALSVNLLGVTPLDFSVNGSVPSMRRMLEERGIRVVSCLAMGDTPEQIEAAPSAHVNLVVSYCGLKTAEYLKECFGTPYVFGRPCGEKFTDLLAEHIRSLSAEPAFRSTAEAEPEILIIGEGIGSASLAKAIELETGRPARIAAAVEYDSALLTAHDRLATDEEELLPLLRSAKVILADPLYRRICPAEAQFVPLPHEAFSGRMFRDDIPDLAGNLRHFLEINHIA